MVSVRQNLQSGLHSPCSSLVLQSPVKKDNLPWRLVTCIENALEGLSKNQNKFYTHPPKIVSGHTSVVSCQYIPAPNKARVIQWTVGERPDLVSMETISTGLFLLLRNILWINVDIIQESEGRCMRLGCITSEMNGCERKAALHISFLVWKGSNSVHNGRISLLPPLLLWRGVQIARNQYLFNQMCILKFPSLA